MISTLVLIVAFVVLLSLACLTWAYLLRTGLKWVKVETVTWRTVVYVTLFVFTTRFLLSIGGLMLVQTRPEIELPLQVLTFAISIALPCLAIKYAFQLGLWRSFLAWLPSGLGTTLMMLLSVLLVRPFLFEAFVSPSNAMAPTLLGPHVRGVCLECGKPTYSTYVKRTNPRQATPPMICESMHVMDATGVEGKMFPADRFLVCKFLKPKRWDVIAFEYPADPSVLYAMRLVGLPGEQINIHAGLIWVNGEKLTPPAWMSEVEYASELAGWRSGMWATQQSPAVLGDDEYFVLGDFTTNANDSRHWLRGSPNHNPYAVPAANIRGVVTHVFWPVTRLRVLR